MNIIQAYDYSPVKALYYRAIEVQGDRLQVNFAEPESSY